MAKQLPGAVSASCLHVVPGDSVSLHTYASSSESHSAFVLWVWRNTLGSLPASYLHHIFWYLPPFSLDTMTTYVGPSSLGSFALRNIPPRSEGICISTSSTSANWPKEIPSEANWDVMVMTLEVPCFVCDQRESWGSQCQMSWVRRDQGMSFMNLLTTISTCSPSACPLLVLVLTYWKHHI